MAGLVLYGAHASGSDGQMRVYALIDTLIDIDIAYERERQTLLKGSQHNGGNARLLTKLRAQHNERRQPVIEHLVFVRTNASD